MTSRYHRSRTPDPDLSFQRRSAMSPVLPRSRIASMKSAGNWGSMNNLDQILSNLQDSIQQKTRECCNSYESLDRLDSDGEVDASDGKIDKLGFSKDIANLDAPSSPKLISRETSTFCAIDRLSSQYSDQVTFRAPQRTLPKVNPLRSRNQESRRNTVHGIVQDLPSPEVGSGHLAGFGDILPRGSGSTGSNLGEWTQSPVTQTSHNSNDSRTNASAANNNVSISSAASRNVLARGSPSEVSSSQDVSPSDQAVRYEYSGVAPHRRLPLTANDMNNNSPQAQMYVPRFTKNSNQAVRQNPRVFPSITRSSRSGALSPVSIKQQLMDTDAPSREVFVLPDNTGKPEAPLENGYRGRHRDLTSESSFDVASVSSEPVSTYSRSESDSSISPSPRSRWGRAEIGHSELMEISSLADPSTPEPSPKLTKKQVRSFASDTEKNLSPAQEPGQPTAPPRRTGRNHLSPSRKMWGKPERCVSPLAQSLHVNKQSEDSPNKGLAFYVPYPDPSDQAPPKGIFDNDQSKKPQSTGTKDAHTDEDRAIKFPQWVIPFIDDDLSGQFEYDGKKVPMKKRSRSVPPGRTKALSPTPQEPRNTTSRGRTSVRTAVPQPAPNTPVAPPRTKKFSNDTRGRPVSKPATDSKPQTKPESSRKKLPVTPTDSKPHSAGAGEDHSDLYPIHYAQHREPTAPARLKKKSTADVRNPPKTTVKPVATSGSLSKFPSRNDMDSTRKPVSNLASRRSKSMGNLSLISQNQKKEPPSRTVNDRHRPSSKVNTPSSNHTVQASKTKGAVEKKVPKEESFTSATRGRSGNSVGQPDRTQNSVSSHRATVRSRTERVTSTSSEDAKDKHAPPNRISTGPPRSSRASSATRSTLDMTRPLSTPRVPSTVRSQADKPGKDSSVPRGKVSTAPGHRRRDSTESESNTSVYSDGRTSSRSTPRSVVRSLSRQDSDSSTGLPDPAQTFTLPRRRTQMNASAHEGGYGTLRPSMTSTPKKSILKSSPVTLNVPDRAPEPANNISKVSRRALPKVPQEKASSGPPRTVTSSRLNQLNRSTSREDVPAKPATNLTRNRAKSMENLSGLSSSRSRPRGGSRPTSPASKALGGESSRVRPRSPVLPSGHVISDRYRRLMDGDFGQAEGQAQAQGQASATPANGDNVTVEKENSFDSGVEFTMHL